MIVGDRQLTTLILKSISSLNLYDISYVWFLSVQTQHISSFTFLSLGVQQADWLLSLTTWWFRDEPIFTLLMLLHLSFCFTGWQFGSGVNEHFPLISITSIISQLSFCGWDGHCVSDIQNSYSSRYVVLDRREWGKSFTAFFPVVIDTWCKWFCYLNALHSPWCHCESV